MEFPKELQETTPRGSGWGQYVEEKARKYIYPLASKEKFFSAMARPFGSRLGFATGDCMSEKDDWHSCSSSNQQTSFPFMRMHSQTNENFDRVNAALQTMDDDGRSPSPCSSDDAISFRTASLYTQSNVRICEFEGQIPDDLSVATAVPDNCELVEVLPSARQSPRYLEEDPTQMSCNDNGAMQKSFSTACIRKTKRSKRKSKAKIQVDASNQTHATRESHETPKTTEPLTGEDLAVVKEPEKKVLNAQDASSQTPEVSGREPSPRTVSQRQSVRAYNQVLHELENVVNAIAVVVSLRNNENKTNDDSADQEEPETEVAGPSMKSDHSVKSKIKQNNEDEPETEVAAPSIKSGRVKSKRRINNDDGSDTEIVAPLNKNDRSDKSKSQINHDSVEVEEEFNQIPAVPWMSTERSDKFKAKINYENGDTKGNRARIQRNPALARRSDRREKSKNKPYNESRVETEIEAAVAGPSTSRLSPKISNSKRHNESEAVKESARAVLETPTKSDESNSSDSIEGRNKAKPLIETDRNDKCKKTEYVAAVAVPSTSRHSTKKRTHCESVDRKESHRAVEITTLKSDERISSDSLEGHNASQTAELSRNNAKTSIKSNCSERSKKPESELVVAAPSTSRHSTRKSAYERRCEREAVEELARGVQGPTKKSDESISSDSLEGHNASQTVDLSRNNAKPSVSGTSKRSKYRERRASSRKSSEKETNRENFADFADFNAYNANFDYYNAEYKTHNAEFDNYIPENNIYNPDGAKYNAELVHNNASYNAEVNEAPQLTVAKSYVQTNEQNEVGLMENSSPVNNDGGATGGASPRKIVIRIAIKNRKESPARETKVQQTQTERMASQSSLGQSSYPPLKEMVSKFTQHSFTPMRLSSEQHPSDHSLITLLSPQMAVEKRGLCRSSHKVLLEAKATSSESSVGELTLKSVPKSMSLTSRSTSHSPHFSQPKSSPRLSALDENEERKSEFREVKDSVKGVSFKLGDPYAPQSFAKKSPPESRYKKRVSPSRMSGSTALTCNRHLVKKSSRDARKEFLQSCWRHSPVMAEEPKSAKMTEFENPGTSSGIGTYRRPPKCNIQPPLPHFYPRATEFPYTASESDSETESESAEPPTRFSTPYSHDMKPHQQQQREQREEQSRTQGPYNLPDGPAPSLSLLLSQPPASKPRNSTQNYVLSLSLEEYLRSKLVMPKLRALNSTNYSILQRNNEMMDGISNLPSRIAGIFGSTDGVD